MKQKDLSQVRRRKSVVFSFWNTALTGREKENTDGTVGEKGKKP